MRALAAVDTWVWASACGVLAAGWPWPVPVRGWRAAASVRAQEVRWRLWGWLAWCCLVGAGGPWVVLLLIGRTELAG